MSCSVSRPVVIRVDKYLSIFELFYICAWIYRGSDFCLMIGMYVYLVRGASTLEIDVLQFQYIQPSIIALMCGCVYLKQQKPL